MNSIEHIQNATNALRPHWRNSGRVGIPDKQVLPPADELLAAQAHAAVAQAMTLTEVAAELRALREAVTRLVEQQPETRRWFRRRAGGAS
ncbi:MAG TPA: hypothetical protein VFG87_23895 [Amycolatopsis sp.]|jgi:hypothetical protein|nr:hypothetical protein [Amycolatopsis sp.]